MAGVGGGGARILRRLTEGKDDQVRFVCTSPSRPEDLLENEAWIPIRPSFGRFDRSRFRRITDLFELPFRAWFRRRIRKFLHDVGADSVHVLPHHNSDSFVTAKVARDLGLSVSCSIHDDFRYVNRGHLRFRTFERELKEVWNASNYRFCIGEEIGKEYIKRYGRQDFEVITDGVDIVDIRSPCAVEKLLKPYFMGLFHIGYRDNLSSFLDCLEIAREGDGVKIDPMRLRCGSLTGFNYLVPDSYKILPFESQSVVAKDIEQSNLLYLPLPFGEAYEGFVKFSFSTKLISYLCSGKLIIYHGPRGSALANYLERKECAIMIYTCDASSIARQVLALLKDLSSIARLTANATQAARSDFDINQIRKRFWHSLSKNER